MIQIAICDDEIGTCSQLEDMIAGYARGRGLKIETEVFYSGETLYRAIRDSCPFDLILLDIQLYQLDGVELGRRIREELNDEKVSIVYISSRETYAMSLFQVRPLDFLVKPITQEKMEDILDKFIRLKKLRKQEFYFHVGKSVCRLYLDEILYFACSGKKVEAHTSSECREFYGGMREVWQQVEGKGFWIIHKSYIVNSACVSVFSYDSLKLSDGTVLPISQKYRRSMKENLMESCRRG